MGLPELPVNSERGQLRWISESELGIDWQDGHVSAYALPYLRKSCPCAMCKVEDVHGLGLKKGIRLRPRPPVTSGLQVMAVEPVGRYAIQFVWSDGHRTGLYSYDYLKELCECAQCQATRKV